MQLSLPQLRNIFKAAAMLPMAALVAGCASYGSFDENEPGLEQSLLGGMIEPLGMAPAEEDIEYSARAPLVAPPNSNALPTPGTLSASLESDPNWPTGSRQRMAQVMENEDVVLVFTPGVDGVDIAATQELRDGRRTASQEDNDRAGRVWTPDELRAASDRMAEAQPDAAALVSDTPRPRRFLTDPPVEARAPSAQAPYGAAAEAAAEEESGGWWPF